jgi:hypothetical protein
MYGGFCPTVLSSLLVEAQPPTPPSSSFWNSGEKRHYGRGGGREWAMMEMNKKKDKVE